MKKIFFLILGMILSVSFVMNEAAAQDKNAPKIRIGEFTGTSGGTVDKTESESSKGLTDADVEFLYKAGFFDEDPFLRHRISVAFNLFVINLEPHLKKRPGGGLDNEGSSDTSFLGIAIQYHCGISFLRDYDWLGNPLFGVNLLLDFSFGSGGWVGNIMTLGFGGEVHFLWICKAAVGLAYVQSENKIFEDGSLYVSPPGRNLPIIDRKSKTLPFWQLGISIPVSKEFDVFALVSVIEDEYYGTGSGNYLALESFRGGVAWKFF